MKFRRNLISLLLTVLLSVTTFANNDKAKGITEHTLENGLKVILIEDHSKAEVFGYIVTKAGAKEDPKDAEGIAHYLEHMLFKGTEDFGTTNWDKEKPIIEEIYKLYDKLKATTDPVEEATIQKQINDLSVKANEYVCQNEFSNIIQGMGGTGMNANTSQDRTVYFNTFPSIQLEKWMEVYANRFFKPVFRGFQAELEVVFEEKNMSLDNPGSVMYEKLFGKVFEGHEYARTVLGRQDHIKKPSLIQMQKFYETYYAPNNMCFILAGDFDKEKAFALIQNKFGKWKPSQLPKETVTPLKPFKGREAMKVKMTPYKQGNMVFRTVAKNHPDEIALEIVNYLLSNGTQTGLLDKLRLDKEVQSAGAGQYAQNDHGIMFVSYTPNFDMAQSTWRNIVQESFKGTEKLIFKQIEKIKKGSFDDWMIVAAKKEFIKRYEYKFETNNGKGVMIGEAFQSNQSIADLLKYPERVNKVTKEDIVNAAKKYLTKNYFALTSSKGKLKPRKIKKSKNEALKPKPGNKSKFAQQIEEMPTTMPKAQFVDFMTDFKKEQLKKGVDLSYSKNPKNNIFNLTIKYGAGEHAIPNLEYASMLMNYAGTLKRDIKKLKEAFGKIACNYSIYSTDNNLVVSINGVEDNLSEALKLFTELLLAPKLEQDKLDLLVSREIGSRSQEKDRVAVVADALQEFVVYGKESEYIDRKSMEDLKALDAGALVGDFYKATKHDVELHYCGAKPFEEVKKIIKKDLTFRGDLNQKTMKFSRDKKKVDKNIIYFIHDKDALQSNVYLYVNGDKFDKKEMPISRAFNQYFNGGFSGIVLQEIRENRSLAYGAGASYALPRIPGKDSYFVGYTSTQADKTVEAVKVFTDIINNMPEKPERMNNIREYLVQSSMSSKPYFRSLTQAVDNWKEWGYKEDPSKQAIEEYKKMTFADIMNFYNSKIKGRPIAICIVGNKKDIDLKALKAIATVKKMSKGKIFKSE